MQTHPCVARCTLRCIASALSSLALVLLMAMAPNLIRAQDARRQFDIPASDAVTSLKQFSEQSGRGLIVASESVRGVRTNAVKGDLTAGDALTRLLEGTGLVASRDQ